MNYFRGDDFVKKKYIDPFEYANEIVGQVNKGILLTTKSGDEVNTMTIGWGMLGVEWEKKIFITYVREGRHSRKLLDENQEFTINVPIGDFNRKILGYCGSKSGKNVDKIKDMNLTLVDSDEMSVPGIKELPLTLECKVLYRKLQDINEIPEDIRQDCYPQDVDSDYPMANKDYHVAYYGEIVKAYIIED